MFCNSCGEKLNGNESVCPKCGKRLELDYYGESERVSESKTTLEETVTTPVENEECINYSSSNLDFDRIRLSENEVVVRHYNCSKVGRFIRSEGYLTVTNRRILFHSKGEGLPGKLLSKNSRLKRIFDSRISKEIALDAVKGVDCYYGLNVSTKRILMGVLSFVFCGFLNTIYEDYYITWMPLLIILLLFMGVGLLVLAFSRSFKVSIYAADCQPSPINLGIGIQSILGNSAVYSVYSSPTEDTNRMIDEIGAVVSDIQCLGDAGVAKWRNL